MIKSFSKINLFLKVLKKNNKGLHNVQSSVMLLDLHDKISLKKINKNKDNIEFTGQFKKKINKKTNTISKSLFLLRKHNLIDKKKRYKITIKKNIPVFAGLGGGTSNAVFLIKYFLNNKISNRLMGIFEEEIGSDFRLFFFNHSFQKNLKQILKFKKKYFFYFVLVYPNINSSTKKVYSKVKKFSLPLKNDLSKIDTKGKYINFIKNEKNDLQKIVEIKHEKIKKILDLIKIQKKCLISRMTGSGSVCFGVFFNKKSAKQGLIKIQKKLPNCWCVLTKSI
jgi:4-diphosphocytidyl-2-C-methyl-D-erythritol kinase